eukprot:22216_1
MENMHANIVQRDSQHHRNYQVMKEYIKKRNHINVCIAINHLHNEVRGDLKSHINLIHTNNGKYACKYCPKRFTKPSQLLIHTRYHTNEKPFKCNVCNRSFTLKGDLNRHKMIHTGEKPFSCNKCGEKFANLSHRNRHQKKYCKAREIV